MQTVKKTLFFFCASLIILGLFFSLSKKSPVSANDSVTNVILGTQVSSDTALVSNKESFITLYTNTHAQKLDGIQLVFTLKGTSSIPVFSINTQSGLQVVFEEVLPVDGGYRISLILVPQSVGDGLQSIDSFVLGQVKLTPSGAGVVSIHFDKARSLTTLLHSGLAFAELNAQDASYTVTGNQPETRSVPVILIQRANKKTVFCGEFRLYNDSEKDLVNWRVQFQTTERPVIVAWGGSMQRHRDIYTFIPSQVNRKIRSKKYKSDTGFCIKTNDYNFSPTTISAIGI